MTARGCSIIGQWRASRTIASSCGPTRSAKTSISPAPTNRSPAPDISKVSLFRAATAAAAPGKSNRKPIRAAESVRPLADEMRTSSSTLEYTAPRETAQPWRADDGPDQPRRDRQARHCHLADEARAHPRLQDEPGNRMTVKLHDRRQAAGDQGQPPDPGRARRNHLHRDHPAHGVTDQVDLAETEGITDAADMISGLARTKQNRKRIGCPESWQVDRHDPADRRQRRHRRLPDPVRRPYAVQEQDRGLTRTGIHVVDVAAIAHYLALLPLQSGAG